jgi:hypothetical protein
MFQHSGGSFIQALACALLVVLNRQDEMRDFLSAIRDHPALFTAIGARSAEGMSISYKLRR